MTCAHVVAQIGSKVVRSGQIDGQTRFRKAVDGVDVVGIFGLILWLLFWSCFLHIMTYSVYIYIYVFACWVVLKGKQPEKHQPWDALGKGLLWNAVLLVESETKGNQNDQFPAAPKLDIPI